jgi:Xaa-Pro aminopeptidase
MKDELLPTLSLQERDRRWQRVREMMLAQRLDCLIVGGFRGREHYESYITDDYVEGAVVFPLEGEPTTLTWTGSRVSRAYESFSRGVEAWVTDYRVGVSGQATAGVIREKGMDRSRIGVVGLESRAPGEMQGYIPYTFWQALTRELPEATFMDTSQLFAELTLVKSEAELILFRYAAKIAEAACQVMLETTRPGVGEEVIYAEVVREIFRHAADARYPTLNLHSGPHNISWGPPRWISRAERPRRVQKGDMVQAEIFPCYGNQEVQVQMSIALDPMDEVNQRCEDVARRSYEAGLRSLRPNITFAELVRAMEGPLRESGCWAKTPLIHSLGMGGGIGFTGVNMEQLVGTQEGRIEGKTTSRKAISGGDLVIRPGMTLAFEPNACIGTHRANIGGALIVTETGYEELNVLPTRVRHIP